MILNDILQRTRNLSGETNPNGRFPNAVLIDLINGASDAINNEVEWPYATYTPQGGGLTLPNIATYGLPDVTQLLRVYLAGEAIKPVTQDILEGNQLGLYDAYGASYTPTWTQITAASYPVARQNSVPLEMRPAQFGDDPQYFVNGGWLTIVPPPANAVSFVIDVIDLPLTLVNLDDVSSYPRKFKDAIAWKTIEYMRVSDVGVGENDSLANAARDRYEAEIKACRAWLSNFMPLLPHGFQYVSPRVYFQGATPSHFGGSGRGGDWD